MARRHCEVVYDEAYQDFDLPCDGTRKTLYTNRSGRYGRTTVSLNVGDYATPLTVTMIIKPLHGSTIVQSATTSTSSVGWQANGFTVSVAGLKSVFIECTGGAPTDRARGTVTLKTQYCRCCG